MKQTIISLLLSLALIAGISHGADFNGDGTGDIAIYRETSGLWSVRGVTRTYFGGSGSDPAVGDYNGNGTDDIAIFRGSSGLWAVRNLTRVYFGGSSDQAKPGDYDGDRTDDFAIFRPTTGMWAARGITRVYYGSSGDVAISPGKGSGPVSHPLPVTGQTTSYRTGDDGDHQAGASFDFDKFTLPSGTITIDNNTGLIWAADGNGKGCNFGRQTDWSSAVAWCENLSFAGGADWRLPNAKEIQTIADYDRTYPAINQTYFPNTQSAQFYWTSTTQEGTPTWAFVLRYYVGGQIDNDVKTTSHYLRAVTGP